LIAYATYAVNATQFILKLRAARLAAPPAAPVADVRGGRELAA
jgi:hypothetical protein